jgi:C4-type Zn-finger protein
MEEPKNVVEFNLSKCPMCGGEMFVLESRYDAYRLDPTYGKFVTGKFKEDNLTELVCSECGYNVEAAHCVYGILPVQSKVYQRYQEQLKSGKDLVKEIGYVEED